MSWPFFLAPTRVPAWLFFNVFRASPCRAHARWWGGRALFATVVNFCVALFVTALMGVALSPHALAASETTGAAACGHATR